MSDGSWLLAQRWSDLLFAHWPARADEVRALVPHPLELDHFSGTAWVSVTPFHLSGFRMRGLPAVPGLSEFPELNVRTYVTFGGRPGVWFFSLDAGSTLAVWGARAAYHLPYFRASMRCAGSADGGIEYASRRIDRAGPPAEFAARYRPVGEVAPAAPGSLDHWLVERYSLYAADRRARLYRADISHRPWPLQPAEATIPRNTMLEAAGITVADQPPRLSFSRRLDVHIRAPYRVA